MTLKMLLSALTIELGGIQILKTVWYFIKYHDITNYAIFDQHKRAFMYLPYCITIAIHIMKTK